MEDERLARYLAGEASADDHAQVEAWSAVDSSNRAELAILQEAWSAQRREPAATWEVDLAWRKVSAQLETPVQQIFAWRSKPVRWLAAAAVLAAVGGGWWYSSRTTSYQTGLGERREIALGDGSRVVLAPGSKLTVGRDRAVELAGKAWFEVRHDPARPFRVQVGQTTIEDLGTEFAVDATAPELRVAVISGSVMMTSATSSPITLAANDLGSVMPDGQAQVAHQAGVERIIAWRKGTLAFDNKLVGEVLAELERWYDVDFQATPAILARTFTGDLPTANLEGALATIGTALGWSATQTGRTISLAPKAAP